MWRIVLTTIGCLWAATLVSAQPLFRAGIDLVEFGVTVLDRGGQLIADLTADDFEIFEDGRRQEIRYFARGVESDSDRIPVHIGLLFDTSESMLQDGDFAKTAAIKFLNVLTYARDMTLVEFDDQVRVGRYAQADFPRLVERIRLRAPAGMTALYDALGVYLDGAFAQEGRTVLLLYTDGEDTSSRLLLHELLDLIRASDVTVYAIGFQKHLRATSRMTQRQRLEQIVELAGGRAYFPDRTEDLDGIYEHIERELHARYSLGYISTNERADGRWRRVEVRLARRPALRSLKVRTRSGYFAPFRESDSDR